MPSEDEGSVTRYLDDLKAGDDAAARVVWDRYFDRLVRLARRRLVLARSQGGDEDEEDAALSAFESFCGGLGRGRFPRLDNRDDLWRILFTITTRKASAQVDRRRSLKRGGDRVTIGLAADGPSLAEIAGREPDPEFAASVAEEFRHLLERLGDDDFRQIALWRMDGYTVDEIAERLGCARRTVARRLELIREIWSKGR